MHGVNLDLLRTTPHHPDGRAKDPHAQHRADLCARLRAERRARWRRALTRVLAWMARAKPAPARPLSPAARR